jgi:cGMP-dependent 3',5'-cyclic phosphodiesterase
MRIAKSQGIAGHVATTGEVLNIRDAYSHPLFYKGIDDMTGFKTRYTWLILTYMYTVVYNLY